MDDITNEQTELLLQFQDLSGIDDLERCKVLLESHQWNIESAVRDTFEEDSVVSVVDSRSIYHNEWPREIIPPPPDIRMPLVNFHPRDQRVFRFVQHPIGFFGWSYWIITYPIQFIWAKFFSIFRYVCQLLRRNQRAITSTPIQDVTDFINDFEKEYGNYHVNFLRLTYAQALNEAKQDLKFLLVYLHSPHHQDTQQFCRDVLCSQQIVNFLGDRILIWGCSINKPEGHKVSQALRETTYPFMSLIVLRLNRMTSVARIEGLITNESLIEKLNELVLEHQTSLITARLDREERNFNVTLRQQQDEAYQQSLLADRERERKDNEKRNEELEKERVIVKKKKEEQERIRRASEMIETERDEARVRLSCEPNIEDTNCIRIMLKLPSGIRLERRFRISDPITLLHDFVFVHEAAPDNFEIVRNMPRQVIACHPTDNPQHLLINNDSKLNTSINIVSLPKKILHNTSKSLPTQFSSHLINVQFNGGHNYSNTASDMDSIDGCNIETEALIDNFLESDGFETDKGYNSIILDNDLIQNNFSQQAKINNKENEYSFSNNDSRTVLMQKSLSQTTTPEIDMPPHLKISNSLNHHFDSDEVNSTINEITNQKYFENGSAKSFSNNAKFSDFGFGKSELLYVHDLDA